MTNAHKTIIALIILCISSFAYALSQRETLEERVERENRETLIKCLDDARSKSTSSEILQTEKSCSEHILTKISRPISDTSSGEIIPPLGDTDCRGNKGEWICKLAPEPNSGTVTPAISGVPLGKNAIIAKKIQKDKVDYASGAIKNSLESAGDSFWTTYDLAIKLIQKYEGLHLKAYPDYKGCSIGWGTRAKSCNEVISVNEANMRLSAIARQLTKTIQSDFPNLTPNQQGALVDFAYNCHEGYRDVKNHGIIRHSLWCRTAGGKILDGLVKRRAEEALFLFSK